MAVDKLVDSTQLDADLTSVANAIRTKGGTSGQLAFPADFVSAIAAISSGGDPNENLAKALQGTLSTLNCGCTALNVGFRQNSYIKHIFLPECTYIATDSCYAWTGLVDLVLPKITSFGTRIFYQCTAFIKADLFGASLTGNLFSGCTKLSTLVIRKTSGVAALSNINAFTSTPFASGKAGGTLYVPSALISSYQSASNWSTILGYSTNSIKSIESTATDPNAPVDLTTHYIDGTLIPT